MLPELRALFDLPRRFLPGLGARVHGYADKRGVEGIQATGANGVFTLGRSETSGTIPSLGTAEEPAALRAGPGVRIHGYGGIHRIERLPAPQPDAEPLGPARLEWEVEISQGYVQVCSLGTSTETPLNFVINSETNYEYANGSYVITYTASGEITAYGPSDPPPDACDAIVSDSTYDPPEPDGYGEFIGSSTSETLVSFASLVSAAVGVSEVVAVDAGSQEWVHDEWRDVSEEVTPFAILLSAVAVAFGGGGGVGTADNVRFRLKNRGSIPLRINCGFYGSGVSGGATDIDTIIDLGRGADSDWQEVPAIDPDPAKYRTAQIRRVRLGRFRFIA